jgi:DNA (cytosine-5)-methyltransferase 1
MRALSLFSGIGGLDIAADWCDIEPVLFCEIDPYARAVLAKQWPEVPIHPDIRTLDATALEVGIVYGGFPCQDLSTAGKGEGLTGERSGLWYEMLRVIGECRPRWVLVENVVGAINLALDTIAVGLETGGYKVWPYVVPALAFGALHRRERLFVVGCRADDIPDIDLQGELQPKGGLEDKWRRSVHNPWRRGERGVARVVYGVPRSVDRIRVLANAVVPQQAYPIFRAIAEMEVRSRDDGFCRFTPGGLTSG